LKDKARLPVELGEAVKLQRKKSKLKATDIAIRSGGRATSSTGWNAATASPSARSRTSCAR
jgi:hypothetical protein